MNTRNFPRFRAAEKIAAIAFCVAIAVFCFAKISNGWEVACLASVGAFFIAAGTMWMFVALVQWDE